MITNKNYSSEMSCFSNQMFFIFFIKRKIKPLYERYDKSKIEEEKRNYKVIN